MKTIQPLAVMTAISILLVSCIGCATMFNGTEQEIVINSEPPGAKVFIDGQDTSLKTPTVFHVKRKNPPTLRIEKKGYEPTVVPLKRLYSGWILGNLFWYGVPALVDFSTGAAYRVSPKTVLVRFPETSQTPIVSFSPVKPPLRSGRVIGEILAGTGVGIVGGITGYGLGRIIAGEPEYGDDIGVYLVYLGMASVGYFLGVPAGVYLVGNNGNETGSFGAAFFGNLLFGPIGATIGFNMTRRYKLPPVYENALINFSDGQMSLAVPTISFDSDRYARGSFTQRVDLVKMGF